MKSDKVNQNAFSNFFFFYFGLVQISTPNVDHLRAYHTKARADENDSNLKC